jgi:hypothetical protein
MWALCVYLTMSPYKIIEPCRIGKQFEVRFCLDVTFALRDRPYSVPIPCRRCPSPCVMCMQELHGPYQSQHRCTVSIFILLSNSRWLFSVDADTVCARAKIHFDPFSRQGAWSESGTTEASQNLEAFKKDYLPLHKDQTVRQYFSVSISMFFSWTWLMHVISQWSQQCYWLASTAYSRIALEWPLNRYDVTNFSVTDESNDLQVPIAFALLSCYYDTAWILLLGYLLVVISSTPWDLRCRSSCPNK